MFTNDAINSSHDIRLYSDELISVKSSEDNESYWFSKKEDCPGDLVKTAVFSGIEIAIQLNIPY